ncbi:MAG: DUF1566 domain-containing protein, partial [Bacteroidales bacterium]|nr:DUF1566 domain-containing protein [Bacteroidales bacterium]
QISFTTVSMPTVTTTTPYSVTSTSTWSGGNVTSDGGGALSDRGICISTSANPTTSDTKASNGPGGTGVFVNAFGSLTAGTIYHIRAYAINAAGTAYGEDKSFIALAVGDSYGGGKVAYIDASLIHGFIAANADKPATFWGCAGTAISGADGQAIGTGNQNTIDIDAGCSTSGIAADVCANLVENGYSDWYLPSVLELWQMYYSRNEIGGFDAGAGVYYWSSSEYSAADAYRLTFNGGTYVQWPKGNTYKVRPVRAF